ncbi:hypothetical protein KDL29_15580 [bacterium]|nr:hypothetical protein [bacterium]
MAGIAAEKMQVLRSYTELGQWADSPVVISVGFFDGVHRGHQVLVNTLRDEAARLNTKSLLITFSNSPRQYHYPDGHWKFLMTPEEKLYALARTGVDAVLMLRYDESICKQQAAMFLRGLSHFAEVKGAVFGYDTSIGSDLVSGEDGLKELCREVGMECRIVAAYSPEHTTIKSSLLRQYVGEGRMKDAAEMMGHPYFVLSRVVKGRGLGKDRLEIPTANQILPQDKLAPLEGIYAGSALVQEQYLPAAIAVMDLTRARSSVVDTGSGGNSYKDVPADAMIVESHILDFSGDIYGEVIRLDFHSRLRDWQDFATEAELRERMQQDISLTRELSEAVRRGWEKMQ